MKVGPSHGTIARHLNGCRCDECVAGHAAHLERRRQRDKGIAPPAPTRRVVREESWQADAACKGRDPGIWYPSGSDGRHEIVDEEALYALPKSICDACPVKATCLARAIANNETEGMWGGTTPSHRRSLKRRRRIVAAGGTS